MPLTRRTLDFRIRAGCRRWSPLVCAENTSSYHRPGVGQQDHQPTNVGTNESAPHRSMVHAQLPRSKARYSLVASSPCHPGFLAAAIAVSTSSGGALPPGRAAAAGAFARCPPPSWIVGCHTIGFRLVTKAHLRDAIDIRWRTTTMTTTAVAASRSATASNDASRRINPDPGCLPGSPWPRRRRHLRIPRTE